MLKRILVPLDGSEHAERAIPVAARIARVSGGTIIFLRVLPPADLSGYAETSDAYADELTGIPTELDLAAGAIPPTIFSTARREHVDLAVMCSRGITGPKRWMLCSVAQEAIQYCPVPMLVLIEHGSALPAPDAAHPLRILVPLDGSVQSETVLEPAVQLIAALATPGWGVLHLLRIVDLPSAYGKLRSQAHISDSMQAEARQEAKAYLKVIADRLYAGTPADLE